MKETKSWDPSLVKKFSSSNHFKLLNQLRNEVKKYPLNNKKKLTSQNNDNNKDYIKKQSDEHTQIGSSNNDFYKVNVQNSNKSNISFNNSKNFSIYNQTHDNNFFSEKQNQINDRSKSIEESSASCSKEILD